MNFEQLGLSENILRAVTDLGYTQPTPIQEQAIPHLLMGRDLIGCAQTGTGKTASFTLPLIEHLASGRSRARMPRTIILEPTRELALQVAENVEAYSKYVKLTSALLIGGERFDEQVAQISKGVDVLIATPGRILDLIGRGNLMLNDIKVFVIDEADRMLDMGFIPDIDKIAAQLPVMRQTVLFSATMPKEIRALAQKYLHTPKEVTVAPPASPAKTVEQKCSFVPAKQKRAALRALLNSETVESAFIFCNRKRDVGIVARSLQKHGFSAASMHGDLPQYKRTETLEKFRTGETTILVCSDVAARGIDVQNISHVFNFDVPMNAEDYVHRIGRTGRAGNSGKSYTLVSPNDEKYFDAVEKLVQMSIPKITIEGIPSEDSSSAEKAQSKPSRKPRDAKDTNKKASTSNQNGQQRTNTKQRNYGNQHAEVIDDHNFNTDPNVEGFGDHTPHFMLVDSKKRQKHTVHKRQQQNNATSDTVEETEKTVDTSKTSSEKEIVKIDIVTAPVEETSTSETKTETVAVKAAPAEEPSQPESPAETATEETVDRKKEDDQGAMAQASTEGN